MRRDAMKGLILDNYDSFTYNLFQSVAGLSQEPHVVRNDAIDVAAVRELSPDFVIISPGPGDPTNPAYFGVCSAVIQELGPVLPMLGVCLGHQGIASVLGGRIVRATAPMHGRSSFITHDGSRLFADVPRRFEAMRYHSLVVVPESLPAELVVTASTDDGTIMAFEHRHWPLFGVQFHPESIGTPEGGTIVRNFIRCAAAWLERGKESG